MRCLDLADGSDGDLAGHCARLRPGDILQPREACKLSLRSSARRWLNLTAEIDELDQAMLAITTQTAKPLLEQFGVGPDVAAALLITAGGNPERLTSEASFAPSAASAPSQTHQERHADADPTEAAAGKRTAHSTPWPWSASAATLEPVLTQSGEPQTA